MLLDRPIAIQIFKIITYRVRRNYRNYLITLWVEVLKKLDTKVIGLKEGILELILALPFESTIKACQLTTNFQTKIFFGHLKSEQLKMLLDLRIERRF